MGLQALKNKTHGLATEYVVGVPAPTESIPPTAEEVRVNAAATAAWETAKQSYIDNGLSEADAEAAAGTKPVDLSDNTKWPTRELKQPAVSAFVDGGIWQDRTSSLYIIGVGLSELIDESKYADAPLRNKINELVEAVNYLLYYINPPAVSVPPTKQITAPLQKL